MAHGSHSIRRFHQQLHQWYAQHGRKDLPWRNTHDPYAIYISEIMLQQTQVKTVLERYYTPFLRRFPTLGSLAASSEKDILQAWQGLGYYNRALNLRAAAQHCGGALPASAEELMALPGIGRNTAHAICAFAYHQPVAVMEANVKRVLSRIFALEFPKDQDLWDKAKLLLDHKQPFDYNQAMMDIGALVCLKRNPHCSQCPAESLCQGKQSPEAYPAAKAKKATPVRHKHVFILRNSQGRYYATPRTSKFLNGLYHFVETDNVHSSIGTGEHRIDISNAHKVGHIRQQYSHFTLEADIWTVDAGHINGTHWHLLRELQQLPFSMAEIKILALIEQLKPAKPRAPKKSMA